MTWAIFLLALIAIVFVLLIGYLDRSTKGRTSVFGPPRTPPRRTWWFDNKTPRRLRWENLSDEERSERVRLSTERHRRDVARWKAENEARGTDAGDKP